MSNMSYCMFENTMGDLNYCVERMADVETRKALKLNSYESNAFDSMYEACKEYIAHFDRLADAADTEEETEDEES